MTLISQMHFQHPTCLKILFSTENVIIFSASPLIIYALQKERLLTERHIGRHVMHHSKISNGNYNFKNESFIKIGKR